MSGDETERARPLRSSRWFRKDDLPGFVHRTTLAAAGWSREDLMTRPIIGILNTWSDINPCNLNLRVLAEEARIGIIEAGGIPFEVPLMSLSENIIKPTSFPFRNLLSMDVEECIRGYPFDAVVLLGGCDKTQPALLMGAVSARIPFIFLASGPATPRSFTGGDLTNATGVWRLVDMMRAGESTKDEFSALERNVMGTVGHCAEMGTASSMAAICEALGLSLAGSSLVPAVDRRRSHLARDVGRRSVALAEAGGPQGIEILDHRAFDNAIALLCAVGGSTNAIIHLLALAGRAGVPLTLDRFDEIGRQVPLIANVQPAGEHLTERLMAAGGVPAILKRLKPFLHLDAATVDGRTLGEVIDAAEVLDPDVIRPLDNPVRAGEPLVVVRGNLAPDGAVMKACAADPRLFRHRGRAVVFEDVQTIADRIDELRERMSNHQTRNGPSAPRTESRLNNQNERSNRVERTHSEQQTPYRGNDQQSPRVMPRTESRSTERPQTSDQNYRERIDRVRTQPERESSPRQERAAPTSERANPSYDRPQRIERIERPQRDESSGRASRIERQDSGSGRQREDRPIRGGREM
jgi:dihydroxy-acid dehydratase